MITLLGRFHLIGVSLFAFAFTLCPALSGAAILGFGDFSGFKINQNDSQRLPGITILPGIHTAIDLTGSAPFEARSIFDKTPQQTSTFTASFIYQDKDASPVTSNAGFAFVLQSIGGGFDAVGWTRTDWATMVATSDQVLPLNLVSLIPSRRDSLRTAA